MSEPHEIYGYGWRDLDGRTQVKVTNQVDVGYGVTVDKFEALCAKASATLSEATVRLSTEEQPYDSGYDAILSIVGWRDATKSEIAARRKVLQREASEAREYRKRQLEEIRRENPELLS